MNKITSNNLKKSFDKWAILSIIQNTKLDEKPVVAWKIVAGQKITVEVIIHIIRKSRNELIIRPIGSNAKLRLADLCESSEKLNFYLPRDMALFQTEVKHIELNGDVRVTIPDMMGQIDRRKHLRLFIQEGINTEIMFNKSNHAQKSLKQQFKKKCFDISAGGLSFIVSKLEGKFFKVGDKISDIKLFIDSRELLLKGTIVNMFDVEPNERNNLNYKGQKICIQYVKTDQNIEKIIDNFVFRYVDVDDAI